MRRLHARCGSPALVLWCMAMLAVLSTAGLGAWDVYTGIQNVGDIAQTSPTGPNAKKLHYGGSGDPELATFEIDVSSAVDMDCRMVCGKPEYRDASLAEASTDWTCTPDSGAIVDGGFATTFTPGSTPMTGIRIRVKVFEGHVYSWADGNYDAPVEKLWNDTLTTYAD